MDTDAEEVNNTELKIADRVSVELGDQGEEGDIEESGLSEEEDIKDEMAPTPDPVPVTTTTSIDVSCDEIDAGRNVQAETTGLSNGSLSPVEIPKRRKALEEAASFNT